VGGKAGHLAELRHDSQLLVPDGFVITTRGLQVLMEQAGLRERYREFRHRLSAGVDSAGEAGLELIRRELAAGLAEAPAPAALLTAIDGSLREMRQTDDTPFTLAVRSSGPEEDQEYSFAGQFRTVLDVAPEANAVFAAYRLVAASLFGQAAVQYHRRMFPGEGELVIAACCQRMVRAAVSGVAYTLDPGHPLDEAMVVVGAWGLGAAVVGGQIATDTFRLGKSRHLTVLEQQIAEKVSALRLQPDGGHRLVELAPELRRRPCLNDEQLGKLAEKLLRLEDRLRRPLDVEWCFGEDGLLYILQARPLMLPVSRAERRDLTARLSGYQLFAAGQGRVAQQGIGCGPVFRIDSLRDLDNFPDNGILVSQRDSAQFIRVMPRAAAILTETGSPVSHMATLCRELQVPCLVGLGEILKQLRNGEVLTVDADDLRIFRGRVVELLAFRATSGMQLALSQEFRLLRRVLNKVSLLNLVDPLLDTFSVGGCRTYHDVLRFVHETAVQELVELGRDEGRLLREHLARHLDLPVPVGVIVIDIGGGLAPSAPPDRVDFRHIVSEPFRAILQGMLFPEVWHRATMPVGIRDLMSSMLSVPADALEGSYTGHNIAIIGANYVNLCFRLGYHFNIIDAYLSEVERDNHIYFRFLGGASDLTKRSRRARMIEMILVEFGFRIKTRGDLVIARHTSLARDDMARILDILGRLVGFTRQLDVRLDSDAKVDYYAEAFMMGNYDVVTRS
jgi:pyruvate,water dikinase